ncbi:NUDIX hydrolase [Methanopyrus sp. SNP6]|uniref:NUDIX domain-containing protein n=1 Tax=Methanopyrus sp. SNP6 TaxID=1937005 RepID=UPI001AEFFFA6|nr:NUDIX hydrolase [Methanopyrus sp. SNP6]
MFEGIAESETRCPCICNGKYPAPALTVDGIVPYREGIVLVRRGKKPFKGKLALPGGFVECGETVEEAVAREVREETGLKVRPVELVGVYSDPERDPRGHVVSVCFKCEVVGGELRAGSDAADVKVVDPSDLTPDDLAFDHYDMLRDAGIVR